MYGIQEALVLKHAMSTVGEDEGSENSSAKVAGKHVEAKLELVSSEVESVQTSIQDSRDAVQSE